MRDITIHVSSADGREERLWVGSAIDPEFLYRPESPPKIGLVIGTYAALPYVHLGLESRRRNYPHVPLLVHDDCSPRAHELRSVCNQYGVDFEANSVHRGLPAAGDLSVFYGGLLWAKRVGVDLLVKFSRRFIPLHDWTRPLLELAYGTQYATFSNRCVDHHLGFRTECLALHVDSWYATGAVEQLRRRVVAGEPDFVECLLHGFSQAVAAQQACLANRRYVRENPKAEQHSGYADWPLLGTSKARPLEGLLWWNSNPPERYHQQARAWELPYDLGDFLNVEMDPTPSNLRQETAREHRSTTRLMVRQYRTGWDYQIRPVLDPFTSQDVWLLDAHAPSLIELEACDEGKLTVAAGLRPGGADRAVYYLTLNAGPSRQISIGQSLSMELQGGDRLTLECRVEDKNGSWNYWALRQACVVPPATMVVGARRPPHLGDAISILCGMEQYAAENEARLGVTADQPLFQDLMEIFEFPHLERVDREPTVDAMGLFLAMPWEDFWLRRFGKCLANRFGGRFGREFYLPTARRQTAGREEVVLCQFDSRSAAPLPAPTLRKIVGALFPGRRIAAIGGSDTPAYLGADFEYRRGDLKFIVEQLQRCQHFVGADSGVAHLAGCLGVPSTVLNLIDFHVVYAFFSKYPQTAVLDCGRLLELLGGR